MTKDELRTMHSSKGLFIFGNRKAEKIRPLPIYKNKDLMRKAGLASVNGELVVINEPPPETSYEEKPLEDLFEDIPLADIEEQLTEPEMVDFKNRLNEILAQQD